MKKYFVCVILLLLLTLLFTSCLFEDDEEEWDAEKVCPETGMNAYGMPNRGTFVDERDGRVYKYTTIGDQVWMAENLKYELPYPYSHCYGMETCKLRGYAILDTVHVCSRDTSHLAEIAQRMQSTCTDNDCIATEWCEKVGRYYTLMENGGMFGLLDRNVVDSVCPKGWHVPTKDEWDILLENVDSKTMNLKSSNLNYYDTTYVKLGTDECAFNAVPSGRLNNKGEFYDMFSESVSFWTQTQLTTVEAYVIRLNFAIVYLYGQYSDPIRCVKDN